jgi:hypothetical protein
MSAFIQIIVGYVLQFLWKKAEETIKDNLVKAEVQKQFNKRVKDVLAEYELVIKEANEKAKDGLTEQEIQEIRAKKIKLEEELINAVPN